MKILDLTHEIDDQMPAYPGTHIPKIQNTTVFEKDGYREKILNITGHTGTHIDSPAHMLDSGKTIDDMEISYFCGDAVVFNLDKKNHSQLLDKVEKYLAENLNIKFMLFYTGWSDFWGKKEYYENYPVIPGTLAEITARSSLNGIGIDAPSVDEIQSNTYPLHNLFFKSGKIIIENLKNLNELIDKEFQFFCFPLKIKQGDGSPVRAVALLNGGEI